MAENTEYKPRTAEERILQLERNLDNALDWLTEVIDSRKTKGSSTAMDLVNKIRVEINEYKRVREGSDNSDGYQVYEYKITLPSPHE